MPVKVSDSRNVMNIIGLLLGALTAISVLATGCQPASQDQINKARQAFGYESDQPKIDTSVSSIAGSWYGACVRDVQRDEFYKQDTINIASGYIEYSSSFFFDSACSSIAFQQSLGGNFELEKEKIKITYSTLSFKPLSSIIIASINTSSFCGYSEWKYNEDKIFNVAVCGYDSVLEAKITRYGSNELFLSGRKLILSKKTTELDQQ